MQDALGEEGRGPVDRVARARGQDDVAGVHERLGDVGDPVLRAHQREDLRVRVEVDPEAAPVPARGGLAERGHARVGRVVVVRRVAGRRAERLDHVGRRRKVGVADPEVDDVRT